MSAVVTKTATALRIMTSCRSCSRPHGPRFFDPPPPASRRAHPRFEPASIRAGRIDHRLDARYAGDRKSAVLRVAANVGLVLREVDAIDLVVGHVALHPLDFRAHALQNLARLFRYRLQLARREPPRARQVALDHVLLHCPTSLGLRERRLLNGHAEKRQSQSKSQLPDSHMNLRFDRRRLLEGQSLEKPLSPAWKSRIVALEFARRGRVRALRMMKSQKLLHVSVLGKLAVLRDGTRMTLPPSKRTRALLAYLAVTARPHSRDRLCTMFWNLPDDPRAALRWSLTRLRPLVDEPGCPRIIADRENVGLDLGRVAVDILSLRSIVRGGIDSISTDALRHVIEMPEGDFLEGLDLPDCQEFQSWCIGEREETRRLRVRLLTALITRLDGVPEDALPHARALTLLEPASEAVHVMLVRLLRTTGRLREAEEHFERAQQQLAEFDVVRTGALRQAVQLPVQPNPSTPPDHLAAARPHTGRLCASRTLREVQFCRTSDHVRIAYASVGDGPPLVWAAHWLSHLSFSWESPIWQHWTEEFAKDHSFVHYDERGNGLSDWDNPKFSVDAFVRDLEAVVDALGFDRFALIGSSKGGATAMAYAARHPERVSHLVLCGAFAQGWRVWGNGAEIERREAIITLTRQGWAQDNPAFRQILTSLLLPDATREEMDSFNNLQRISASAENAARLLQSSGEINVLDLLPSIAAPTLVLHCRDDAAMPLEQGRLIASRIPRARLVPLESRNHVLLPRDPAWAAFLSEVRRFLREGAPTMSGA